jgi:hypothetical protein
VQTSFAQDPAGLALPWCLSRKIRSRIYVELQCCACMSEHTSKQANTQTNKRKTNAQIKQPHPQLAGSAKKTEDLHVCFLIYHLYIRLFIYIYIHITYLFDFVCLLLVCVVCVVGVFLFTFECNSCSVPATTPV